MFNLLGGCFEAMLIAIKAGTAPLHAAALRLFCALKEKRKCRLVEGLALEPMSVYDFKDAVPEREPGELAHANPI